MLEFLLNAHHALAQLDLVDRRQLSQGLLGKPLPEIPFDVRDVFRGEVRGGHWHFGIFASHQPS